MAMASRTATTPARTVPGWVCWALVAAAVLVQIVYPLTTDPLRTRVTVVSVVVFAAASLADVARRHGARGVLVLLGVAGGGGLVAEAVGVGTGFPFGDYAYAATLGAQVLGVPVVVPLAWVMMAWPALVVGRALGRGPVSVVVLGGAALAAWDLFLDPQMVDAGHWSWTHPTPALPLVPGVPLTNYAGWLLVALLMVAALHRALGAAVDRTPSGPAAALYLWTYGSSVLAHLVFFDLPGSALVGGLGMGLVALPFARVVARRVSRPASAAGRPARSGRTR
ncbi:carotenoid biosynthesis protein [Pseudonocardia humida]|uniref:Carotenoid biosynthesis protein n=1 Tax=Pseudonocardia humida TaxID=2800819 RepID=A0ABT1ABB5_9PSEU|nr:carotenoid biosynthesis protein [Pseudonocardia humida]MCO1660347.1 carotenoid biosynthesis protein [Pseudonocardia humida]